MGQFSSIWAAHLISSLLHLIFLPPESLPMHLTGAQLSSRQFSFNQISKSKKHDSSFLFNNSPLLFDFNLVIQNSTKVKVIMIKTKLSRDSMNFTHFQRTAKVQRATCTLHIMYSVNVKLCCNAPSYAIAIVLKITLQLRPYKHICFGRPLEDNLV